MCNLDRAHFSNKSTRTFIFEYLLNKFNASREVHAKIDELPLNVLLLVLFLLLNEHVVIEELL